MKTHLKTLSRDFGLTHRQIADFLGIHHSVVTRVILGEKPLPDKAVLPLQLIARSLQHMKKQGKVQRPVKVASLKQRAIIVQEEIVRCRIEIKRLDGNLRQMKRRQINCDNINTLVSILEQHKDQMNVKRHERWLKERQYQVNQQSAACHTEKQWRTALQLNSLAQQLAFYEEQLTVIKHQINNS